MWERLIPNVAAEVLGLRPRPNPVGSAPAIRYRGRLDD